MINPIYLILTAVFLYSTASIVRKKLSVVGEDLDYIFTILFQFVGGFFVIIFAILMGFAQEYLQFLTEIDTVTVVRIVIGSALWFAVTFTTFKALNTVTASKFSIIESLSPIFSIILAYLLLGESLTPLQIGGTALIFISVFTVVYDKETVISRFSKGEAIAVLAAVLTSLAMVNDKTIYAVTSLAPTLTILFILPGVLGIIVKPKELEKIKLIKSNKQIIKLLLVMSAIWALAAIFYYKAIVISNSVSLVSAIGQLTTIVTVIMGVVILKEVENWQLKLVASIISVVGLILVGA